MSKDFKSVLNLGSGKVDYNPFSDFDFIVNLDRSYDGGLTGDLSDIETIHYNFLKMDRSIPVTIKKLAFSNLDLYDFLYTYKFKFDHINADRIFEHQFYDSGQVGQLLDACNQITNDDATMDITVPNHYQLAKCLIDREENDSYKPSDVLLLSTEYMNTRVDPHGSVWTPKLAKYYFEAEGNTWLIDEIIDNVYLKGRDCYMTLKCSKPKGNS